VKIHEKFCFAHGRHIMEPRIQVKYMKNCPWSPRFGTETTGEIHEKITHGHHVRKPRIFI
jgi:hypothetical protein